MSTVTSFTAAYRVVGWYECRWIIEEYHKGSVAQLEQCQRNDRQDGDCGLQTVFAGELEAFDSAARNRIREQSSLV